jgi:eukaryotic-like serine/threonine-protein kinase
MQAAFALSQREGPITQTSGSDLLRGRYRWTGVRLGSGGTGTVRQAANLAEDGGLVAVKRMGVAGLTTEEIDLAQCLFRREALILGRLSHPLLPGLVELFFEEDVGYLVMDFIEGETLYERRRRGGVLTLESILDIGIALCGILHYLHERPIPVLHRDIKPENIMLCPDGSKVLFDFGMARLYTPDTPGQRLLPIPTFWRGKTQGHDTFNYGSQGYAPLEQYPGGEGSTPRSDLYSLGALLHQLLSGRHPATNHPRFMFPALPRSLPRDLVALVRRMVAKYAAARPESAACVQDDLMAVAAGLSQEQLLGVPVRPFSHTAEARAYAHMAQ